MRNLLRFPAAVQAKRLLGLLASVLFVCTVFAATVQARPSSATELETRLFAPCCWVQTLDVHESELADKLRHEIERRLAAGEPALQIEDDLVARYGERIRAVPRDSDPRGNIPLIIGVALGLTLFALGSFAVRWRRNQHSDSTSDAHGAAGARYDEQLDQALRSEEQDDPPRSAA